VNSINYSNGTLHNFEYNIPSHHGERCLNVKYAEQAARELDIPISVVGRITTPEECCDIIENKKIAMAWVARQFLADPKWLIKAHAGEGRVRRCLGCNLGCIGRYARGLSIGCAVNYEIGHEVFYENMRKVKPEHKNLLVVGGGVEPMAQLPSLASEDWSTPSERFHDAQATRADSGGRPLLRPLPCRPPASPMPHCPPPPSACC
jgi:2-enoate reductase